MYSVVYVELILLSPMVFLLLKLQHRVVHGKILDLSSMYIEDNNVL